MNKEFKFHFRKITTLLLVVAMVFGMDNTWNVQKVLAAQVSAVESADENGQDISEEEPVTVDAAVTETVTADEEFAKKNSEDEENVEADVQEENSDAAKTDVSDAEETDADATETEDEELQSDEVQSAETIVEEETIDGADEIAEAEEEEIDEEVEEAIESDVEVVSPDKDDAYVEFENKEFVKYFCVRYLDRFIQRSSVPKYKECKDALNALDSARLNGQPMKIEKSTLDYIIDDIQKNVIDIKDDNTAYKQGGYLDFHFGDTDVISSSLFSNVDAQNIDFGELKKLNNVTKLRIWDEGNYLGKTALEDRSFEFPDTLQEVEIKDVRFKNPVDFSNCDNLKVVKFAGTLNSDNQNDDATINFSNSNSVLKEITLDGSNITKLTLPAVFEGTNNLIFSAKECRSLKSVDFKQYKLKDAYFNKSDALKALNVNFCVNSSSQTLDITECRALESIELTCSFGATRNVLNIVASGIAKESGSFSVNPLGEENTWGKINLEAIDTSFLMKSVTESIPQEYRKIFGVKTVSGTPKFVVFEQDRKKFENMQLWLDSKSTYRRDFSSNPVYMRVGESIGDNTAHLYTEDGTYLKAASTSSISIENKSVPEGKDSDSYEVISIEGNKVIAKNPGVAVVYVNSGASGTLNQDNPQRIVVYTPINSISFGDGQGGTSAVNAIQVVESGAYSFNTFLNVESQYINLIRNAIGDNRVSCAKYVRNKPTGASAETGSGITVTSTSKNNNGLVVDNGAIKNTTTITIGSDAAGGQYKLSGITRDNYYNSKSSYTGNRYKPSIGFTNTDIDTNRNAGFSEVSWPNDIYVNVVKLNQAGSEICFVDNNYKDYISNWNLYHRYNEYKYYYETVSFDTGDFLDVTVNGSNVKNGGYRLSAAIREKSARAVLELVGNDGNNSWKQTLQFKDGVETGDVINLISNLSKSEITIDFTISNAYLPGSNGGTFKKEYSIKVPVKAGFGVKYYLNEYTFNESGNSNGDGTTTEYNGSPDIKIVELPEMLSNPSQFELKGAPVRKGYVFDGWYTAKEHTEGTLVTNLLKDKTGAQLNLYAHWNEANGLTIAPLNGDYVYTGAAICPVPRVYNSGILMVKDRDYTVKYLNNVNAYTYQAGDDNSNRPCVVVTGKGSYSGTQKAYFNISAKNISDSDISVSEVDDVVASDKEVKPVPSVIWGKKVLDATNDYKVEYYKKGDTGVSEDAGKITISNSATTAMPIAEGVYFIKVIANSSNYTGSVIRRFEIVKEQASLSFDDDNDDCTLSAKAYYYSPNGVCPEPTVKYHGKLLAKGTDYELEYQNNTAVYELFESGDEDSRPCVIVKGKGVYSSLTKTLYFRIVQRNLGDSAISITNYDGTVKEYPSGEQVDLEPKIVYGNISLEAGTDYDIVYYERYHKDRGYTTTAPNSRGCYLAVINGKNNYCGSREISFDIFQEIIDCNIELDSDSVNYTGGQIKPKVTVTTKLNNPEEDKVLVNGKDYTISYSNNIIAAGKTDPKAPTVIIKGKGKYSTTKEVPFEIKAWNISGSGFTVAAIPDAYYSGKPIEPSPKVLWGKKTLKKGTDYEITYYVKDDYTSPVAPAESGEYRARITGIGNFTGTVDRDFLIVSTDMKMVSRLSVSVKNKPYNNGEAVTLSATELVVKDGRKVLSLYDESGEEPTGDYAVSYANNTEIGTATVTITGKGSTYIGTKTVTFNITGTELKKVKLNGFVSSFQYEQGEPITQRLGKNDETDTCYLGTATNRLKGILAEEYELKSDAEKRAYDYTYEYKNNILPGKATLVLTGVNQYTGVVNKQYTITGNKLVNKLKVTGLPSSVPFTGAFVFPKFDVMNGRYKLKGINAYHVATEEDTEGYDYVFMYRENYDIGKAYVDIYGVNGYEESMTKTFNITGIPVSKLSISNFVGAMEYTGNELTQNMDTEADNAVTFSYQASRKAAKETIIAMSKEEYESRKDERYKDDLDNIGNVGCVYEYVNNTNAGTATMIITGVNRFTGTIKKTFKITPYNFATNNGAKMNVTLIESNNDPFFPYSKSGVCPEPTVKFGFVTLYKGKDYKLSYQNNKAVNNNEGKNKTTVKITGIGNYKGDINATFRIVQKDISGDGSTLTAPNMLYTGKKNTWKAAVTAFDNQGNKLVAKNDYEANVEYEYSKIVGNIWDGTGRTPVELTGDNARKVGDIVQPNDILPAGTEIKATIKGKNNYTGEKSVVYRIAKANISKMAISVNKTFAYAGEPIQLSWSDISFPEGISFASKDEFDKQFEIVSTSYKKNMAVGKASVVIRAKEGSECDYLGSRTLTFNIVKNTFAE